MIISFTPALLPCVMMISAIIIACWAASLKSRIVDVIVGVVIFLILSWILLSFLAPMLHWF